METLMVLTYAAFCIAIFKLFKIPMNKWTVPTAVLGGIVLVGTLVFAMNYNHPYSEATRSYFVSTPINPAVSGIVAEVPVKPNQQLKKGDILFRIDATPFQAKLDSLKAQLTSAKADQSRAAELVKRNVGNRRNLDLARANVQDLTAQIVGAQYNLDHTVVRAPADGFVTQVSLRPGVRAARFPISPSMIFIPQEQHYYTAWMRQNSQLRLKAGDQAEIAFDGIPGQVFSGKVSFISKVIGEGQVRPSGDMISYSKSPPPGRVPVFIEITDPKFDQYRDLMPGGAYAQAAIYTEHFHHLSVMRKILLRMSSWLNYIFPFH
ncbi:HlyD family secretion protein [Pseudomonas sp. M30-35]|uniref:HlyD family secretion protein n=1 Tax=Pseudomonas sp. M30-35 TaxID=1981174 RepID=UPI000B3D3A88|nr:HlyD family secretion protein [Pseudomonas sp. M30-35]ARU88776.1 efflux transporter periplasmic adaptor subunit [Pseudomonas sp. M30-35]